MSAGGSQRPRPGRFVIGTLALDQHEVGAVAISRALVRAGHEVVYLGRFNTPRRLVEVAVQEDADVVGVSVHSWEFTAYVDELVARCREAGIGLVLGGSVLTDRDRVDLLGRGVDGVFGPYAPEPQMLTDLAAVVERVRTRAPSPGPVPGTAQGAQAGRPPAGSVLQDIPLAGRVIAVTGAAHGLGRAYAIALCSQGAAVVANDLDEDMLGTLPAAIAGGTGQIALVPGDITAADTPARLLGAALTTFGQLHGLVSNAGLLRSGPILRLEDTDLDLMLEVHVAAAFRLLRVIGGYWREQARAARPIDASVTLTTSAAGLYGFRAEAVYSAAKAAVAMAATVAADEMARFGTRVNAIAPVARTRLTRWLGDPPDPADDALSAERVAPVVAWLLSPMSRGVTGRVLEVSGGHVSIPRPWEPGEAVALPLPISLAGVDASLRRALATSTPPRDILAANPLPGA